MSRAHSQDKTNKTTFPSVRKRRKLRNGASNAQAKADLVRSKGERASQSPVESNHNSRENTNALERSQTFSINQDRSTLVPTSAAPSRIASRATSVASTPSSISVQGAPSMLESVASAKGTASKSPSVVSAGASDSSTLKKRKRANKPAGLAQMLEAKRKQEATSNTPGAGSSMGLQDFLRDRAGSREYLAHGIDRTRALCSGL
ncbi:hypothetical protein OIO90_005802 [Microbotryomycetes sp. JL221]|nr:hypothetical protein OIO90_005802 [Microbotryomycetes sp. JL221]